MNAIETKRAIENALKSFGTMPLVAAAVSLFESLGYKSQKRIALLPNTVETFLANFAQNRPLNSQHALLTDWQSVYFLFQLTDDEVRAAAQGNQQFLFDSQGKWNGAAMESYLLFAVSLAKPNYTRTQLSTITRAVNRLFDMPAMILFRHGDALTLAVINRRLHKRDESKDVLEKVTLIKDIRFANPHRAHVEILFDLSFDALHEKLGFTNFVALHAAWQKTLDTSVLNQRFYVELANWYFWALEEVAFPKDAPKDRDGRDSLSVIRLITRLIFCWFLKEKALIPEELFQVGKVSSLLDSLKDDENTYYTAILQNLFFATLNTEMDQVGKPPSRRFIDETKDNEDSEDHMVHQVWRYEERIKDKTLFTRLMRTVPFLNGGLFECLDERMERNGTNYTREVRVDGFSVKPAKQPKVPNSLFFGPQRTVDLSKAYGELRYNQTKVWPLIPLLERYKFTVSENTPIEEEIALDPELLGHVFENLLAAYNPETDTTARKTTGSFYTPRVVVDFMVDESVIAYLGTKLPASKDRDSHSSKLHQLLAYTAADPDFTPAETAALVQAIDQVKILDPACGSGAFPMGALHKLVFILGKLDPGNAAWKERQLAKARQLDVGREAAELAVQEAFDRDQGDFARKLYLIENCLFGLDIQPIAVQITKLRCFISLIVEQEPDDKLPNRGILPLPNLETKFIAANTLFGLHRRGQMELVAQDVESKKSELRTVRHQHFRARRFSEKKALRKRDKQLRAELADLLKSNHLLSGLEAEIIASWDPYHADHSAPVFDAEWMFDLDGKNRHATSTLRGNFTLLNETHGQMEIVPSVTVAIGFDIVIGNPPYVRQEELTSVKALEGTPGERPLKEALQEDYFCYTGTADLYVYFYEKSFDLLAVGGVLCFISSNKYFRAAYGEKLRHFLAVNGEVRTLIDFGDAPVFTAIAYPSIILVRKLRETRDKGTLNPTLKDINTFQDLIPASARTRTLSWVPEPPIEEFPEIFFTRGFEIPQRELKPGGWRLESAANLRLLEKVCRVGPALGEYVRGRIYRGIVTGLNDAFVIDGATRARLIAEDSRSNEIIKPWLRGRDVKRWKTTPKELWLCYIGWETKINQYPGIKHHLAGFQRKLMDRPEVKAGRVPWYAMSRYASDYWQEFEKPKVVLPAIADDVEYAVDRDGFYSNDKTSICVPEKPEFTCALLNSHVLWWVMRQTAATKQGGFYEFKPMYVSKLPIATGNIAVEEQITELAKKVIVRKEVDASAFVDDLESEINGLVAHLYGLTEEEYRIILDSIVAYPGGVGALSAYRESARKFEK